MNRRATADASPDQRVIHSLHKHRKDLEQCFRISCPVMKGLDAARKRSPAAGKKKRKTDIMCASSSPLSPDKMRLYT